MSGSGICWAICKSAPHPRQPRQHPTTQFFTGWMPFLTPNQQRQSTEGKYIHTHNRKQLIHDYTVAYNYAQKCSQKFWKHSKLCHRFGGASALGRRLIPVGNGGLYEWSWQDPSKPSQSNGISGRRRLSNRPCLRFMCPNSASSNAHMNNSSCISFL